MKSLIITPTKWSHRRWRTFSLKSMIKIIGFKLTSSSGSKLMVSMSTGDSSLTSIRARIHLLTYSWYTYVLLWLRRRDDLLVAAGWLGSTAPLALFLLVSSSPDSSDSPLRSTAVKEKQCCCMRHVQPLSDCHSKTTSGFCTDTRGSDWDDAIPWVV